MPDFTTSKSLFELLLAPVVPLLDPLIQAHQSDWRYRNFKTKHHFFVSIFAQLTGAKSANGLVEELNDTTCTPQTHQRSLRELIGFNTLTPAGAPVSLDQSNFSRANAHRPYQVWADCFYQLLTLARKHCSSQQLAGLERVLLIDGSLFACLDRMVWASYAATTNKVKGHFFLDLDGLPDQLVLTNGKGNEREVLRTNFRPGFTYVCDRGYKDHPLYQTLLKANSDFVTRLPSNAHYRVLASASLKPAQVALGVVSDETIVLGRQLATALRGLRLITFRDSQGHTWRYLTSRTDLEAITVVELYLRRWEIEFFFRWIKRHLQLKHWYSECENGVLIQLYAALITFLLLKLYTALGQVARFKRMNIDYVRWIERHLFGEVAISQVIDYFHLLGLATTLLQT